MAIKYPLFCILAVPLFIARGFSQGGGDPLLTTISNDPDLTTFYSLFNATGGELGLPGPDVEERFNLPNFGPYTAFAPTNDAFEKLPEPVIKLLTAAPSYQLILAILRAHIAQGSLPADNLNNGSADLISVEGFQLGFRLEEGGTKINGQAVLSADEPLQVVNGLVYKIDRVIDPFIGYFGEDENQVNAVSLDNLPGPGQNQVNIPQDDNSSGKDGNQNKDAPQDNSSGQDDNANKDAPQDNYFGPVEYQKKQAAQGQFSESNDNKDKDAAQDNSPGLDESQDKNGSQNDYSCPDDEQDQGDQNQQSGPNNQNGSSQGDCTGTMASILLSDPELSTLARALQIIDPPFVKVLSLDGLGKFPIFFAPSNGAFEKAGSSGSPQPSNGGELPKLYTSAAQPSNVDLSSLLLRFGLVPEGIEDGKAKSISEFELVIERGRVNNAVVEKIDCGCNGCVARISRWIDPIYRVFDR